MKIAIDGPAGAGKSTVAKEIAEKLNCHYLDTGAMYRAIAYYMLKNNISLSDTEAMDEALNDIDMDIFYDQGIQHTVVNGEDVTSLIRSDEIARGASAVGTNPQVRIYLVELQRRITDKYDVVMDGRDIGTYVLPDADFKFYLTADAGERAKRRYLQNGENNKLTLSELEEEIKKRDYNDMHRSFAPLSKAEDAILIDTTNLTAEQTINTIISIIKGV